MAVLNSLFPPIDTPVGDNSHTAGLPCGHQTPDELFCKPNPSTWLDDTGAPSTRLPRKNNENRGRLCVHWLNLGTSWGKEWDNPLPCEPSPQGFHGQETPQSHLSPLGSSWLGKRCSWWDFRRQVRKGSNWSHEDPLKCLLSMSLCPRVRWLRSWGWGNEPHQIPSNLWIITSKKSSPLCKQSYWLLTVFTL